MGSQEADLNELAQALAHWLEAAQAVADDPERRMAALEAARVCLVRSRRPSDPGLRRQAAAPTR